MRSKSLHELERELAKLKRQEKLELMKSKLHRKIRKMHERVNALKIHNRVGA